MPYSFKYYIENTTHANDTGTVLSVVVRYECESSREEHGVRLRYSEEHEFRLDPPGDDFILLNELTPDIVMGWVSDDIDHEGVKARLTSKMDKNLEERSQSNNISTGLPWNAIEVG